MRHKEAQQREHMTDCSHCGHAFSASQALCDDWRDPNKSFGCPQCGTFFVKDMRPASSDSIVSGLVGGGIMTPAMMLLAGGIREGDTHVIVMSSVIMLSVVGILVSKLMRIKRTLEVSPHHRAP